LFSFFLKSLNKGEGNADSYEPTVHTGSNDPATLSYSALTGFLKTGVTRSYQERIGCLEMILILLFVCFQQYSIFFSFLQLLMDFFMIVKISSKLFQSIQKPKKAIA